MGKGKLLLILLLAGSCLTNAATLPFSTLFKGRDRFERLIQEAREHNWKALPIGERTASVGRALVGTPYKSYTLEIDNHIEAPSVNFYGMDCWTFFEISLGFARMLDEQPEDWTPQTLLKKIELDRYRDGQCTGNYLSRLHYLEDWLYDNNRRGLVDDLTRQLGGERVRHAAHEMTYGWRHYRYLRANRNLMEPLGEMEARVTARPLYQIPKHRVARIESKLKSGDIIGIISRDRPGYYSTSHVGLAYRSSDGVLHFMHASSPHNYGKVVVDLELAKYLAQFHSDTGILVARPLK
jgi:hypothetical protein